MGKPRKPYPTFPLTPHVRGGWSKKYKGKQLYIPFADPDKALADFHRRAQAIDTGKEPERIIDVFGLTLGELCTRYTYHRNLDFMAGKLSKGAFNDYKDAMKDMLGVIGRDVLVSELSPDDFTRFYRHLVGRKLGAHALGRIVQCVRSLFKHAAENTWIPARPNFGTVFRKPLTGHKEGLPFTPEEVGILIGQAKGQLRCMVLLMVNAGYTPKDCSALPVSAVDLKNGVVRFPRPKMKNRNPIDRAVTLWPETAEALRLVIERRQKGDLVFRTIHGNPWVTDESNSVLLMFRRLCKKAGIEPRGPSWLRHLFSTTADELEKPNAKARIMGHRLPGLNEVYVDAIEHVRLQQITDYVRSKCLIDQEAPPDTFPMACLI